MMKTTSESLKAIKVFIFQQFRFYEQLKFYAQLSTQLSMRKVLGPGQTVKTHDMLDIANKLRTICCVEQKTAHFQEVEGFRQA